MELAELLAVTHWQYDIALCLIGCSPPQSRSLATQSQAGPASAATAAACQRHPSSTKLNSVITTELKWVHVILHSNSQKSCVCKRRIRNIPSVPEHRLFFSDSDFNNKPFLYFGTRWFPSSKNLYRPARLRKRCSKIYLAVLAPVTVGVGFLCGGLQWPAVVLKQSSPPPSLSPDPMDSDAPLHPDRKDEWLLNWGWRGGFWTCRGGCGCCSAPSGPSISAV